MKPLIEFVTIQQQNDQDRTQHTQPITVTMTYRVLEILLALYDRD